MMIQYATKDFSPLFFELRISRISRITRILANFELWGLNYEFRELHEFLSLIRGIRVIRSLF